MASNVVLTVRNESESNPEIIIFQPNLGSSGDDVFNAWQVLDFSSGPGTRQVRFSTDFDVVAIDPQGRRARSVAPGESGAFRFVEDGSGAHLESNGAPPNPKEITVLNGLRRGAIRVEALRDGKVVASKAHVAPEQEVAFLFKPAIQVAVASGLSEGDAINATRLGSQPTELDLEGISSADVVVTGGGTEPYSFALENVVRD